MLITLSCFGGASTHAQSRVSPGPTSLKIQFPADSGVINVRSQYGATGDGVTDDTAAVTRAIRDNRGTLQRILFFPAGTYLVSDTLTTIAANGSWRARITLQGESERSTIIRLKDKSADFQAPSLPRPVIQTGSIEPFDKQDGSGNNGFRNYIFDLTIDTGRDNPGAIGIDFLGNNSCGIERVTIKSGDPHGMGVAGLSMKRRYVGPCFYKDIEIDGFDVGVTTNSTEYSHTFEHLLLNSQRVAGINNAGNVLSIRDLQSTNAVPAIINSDEKGLITLVDSTLIGSNATCSAVQNSGVLFMHRVRVVGYAATLTPRAPTALRGDVIDYLEFPAPSGTRLTQKIGDDALREPAYEMPVEEGPTLGSGDLTRWLSVTSKGADASGRADSTKAIQQALDSSADVVFLPTGTYKISDTIHVRGKTARLIGFGAVLLPSGPRFADASSPQPVLNLESSTSDICIEGIQFGWWTHKDYPGAIWLENTSSRTTILRHLDFEGASTAAYKGNPGHVRSLFIEDVVGPKWEFVSDEHVWARQLNAEGAVTGPKIVNDGASVWILGLKTEGTNTIMDTEHHGTTELLGALLYPVRNVDPATPAFIVNDGVLSVAYATSAYRAETNFQVNHHLQHGAATTTVSADSLPQRGLGTFGITGTNFAGKR